MKNRQWLKIPILFVIGHSALLFIAAMAMAMAGHGDSSFGLLITYVLLYFVDFPISRLIALLFHSDAPHNALGNPLLTIVVLYGIAGNLVWFALGTVVHFCIAPLLRRRRP